jgi:hypothetical protein
VRGIKNCADVGLVQRLSDYPDISRSEFLCSKFLDVKLTCAENMMHFFQKHSTMNIQGQF